MSKVRIFALGGLDEDGKNMYVIENNKDIFCSGMRIEIPRWRAVWRFHDHS